MSSFIRKHKYGKEVNNATFLRNGQILLRRLIVSCNGKHNTIRDFSAEELERATNNYGKVIAKDSSHILYEGFLLGRPISVMKCRDKEGNSNGFEYWLKNIVFPSRMSHKNILKLIGCCLETNIPIIVFELVGYGTLADHIYGTHQQNFEPLLLGQRLKIAMEIANALAYLHLGFPEPLVHRDVRPYNILLDEQYVPKLFNFSLSESIPKGKTHIKGSVMKGKGTPGFLAPEYFGTNDCSEKCDVYSFGGLLLVLLTGREIVNRSRLEDLGQYVPLVGDVIKHYQKNTLNEIYDSIFFEDGAFPEKVEQLEALTELALQCLNSSPEDRPTMDHVAKQLRQMYKPC